MLLHRIKTEALDVDIEQVLGYGCWCNFQTNVRGKGAPLDDFDKVCHKWAQEWVETFFAIKQCGYSKILPYLPPNLQLCKLGKVRIISG